MWRMQAAWLAAGVLFLGGCAGTGGTRGGEHRDPNGEVDASKIETVSQWAQARGATIIWVHYPRKPRSSDGR
jgi:hypothetical protein